MCPGHKQDIWLLPTKKSLAKIHYPWGAIRTDNTHSLMTVLFCFFGTAPNCFSCVIQSGEKPSNVQEAVHLIPEMEAGGHFLSPAFLQLSPHQAWLATVGRDGLLRICEISTMVLSVKTTLNKFIHVYEHLARSNMFLRKCPNIWRVCK